MIFLLVSMTTVVFSLSFSFLMFTLLSAQNLIRASRSFAERFSCESKKHVVDVSCFVCTKQFSSTTEGCGGGLQLNVT